MNVVCYLTFCKSTLAWDRSNEERAVFRVWYHAFATQHSAWLSLAATRELESLGGREGGREGGRCVWGGGGGGGWGGEKEWRRGAIFTRKSATVSLFKSFGVGE